MPSPKKPKTTPKTNILNKKNMTSKIFGMPQASCFLFPKKIVFQGVFGFFFMKKSLILSALKQKVACEIKQSNGKKSPQNLLSQDFL